VLVGSLRSAVEAEPDRGPQEIPHMPLMARPLSFREPAPQLAEAPLANLPGQVAAYHSST
jgi:hypothetical protein